MADSFPKVNGMRLDPTIILQKDVMNALTMATTNASKCTSTGTHTAGSPPYEKGVPWKWPVDYGYMQAHETVAEGGSGPLTIKLK